MTDLRLVPGIGAKKEKELIETGCDSTEKLRGADPDQLYLKACDMANRQPDKCVLYAFLCAVGEKVAKAWNAGKDRMKK
jgi:hypothetical protein